MINCLIVGLGGAAGTILRYLIGLIPVQERMKFPIKTFLINIAGCFLIGIISALAVKINAGHEKTILLLKVGLCGGFTTFSTFALESATLAKNGNIGISFLYIILSVAIGICAVYAAQFLISK
ncbi:MAG: fluoride efflux transporter CrcB [Treponema sp.]|nr:fluoride efflux transporter CrcB [Treponema sp.]